MADIPKKQLTHSAAQMDELLDEVPNKVDKVEGKDLSTNDYTDDDKQAVIDASTAVRWSEHDYTDIWRKGGLNNSGVTINANNRVRTAGFIDTSGKFKTYIDNGYKLRIGYYSDAKEVSFVGYGDWATEGGAITPLARYAKLLGGKTDDSDFTDDEVAAIEEHLKLYELISDSPNNPFKGLKIAVIGDSISTNGNDSEFFNAPEIKIKSEDQGVQLSAYLTYYDVQNNLQIGGHIFTNAEIGTEVTFTPNSADVGKKIGLPKNYNEARITVWWEHVQEELGCEIIPVCWSGSSITSHEEATADKSYLTSYAWHDAQIRKCGIRTPGTMTRTAPDAIIIYRGTNDFSHSPYAVLTDGYFDSVNWEYPVTDKLGTWADISATWTRGGIYPSTGQVIPTSDTDTTNRARTTGFMALNGNNRILIASGYKAKIAFYSGTSEASYVGITPDWITEDSAVDVQGAYCKILGGYTDDRNVTTDMLTDIGSNIVMQSSSEVTFGYKEGLCLTIKKLRAAYPNAKIFLCTLNVFKRVNYAHFPTNNGDCTLPQYNNAIREVADYMGCGLIEFDKDGITFENCYSQGYITDSATTPTHPSEKGHYVMGRKAIADLKAQFSKMG